MNKIEISVLSPQAALGALDHATLSTLRDRHPAWRLLGSKHAPLVASFLHRVFVAAERALAIADEFSSVELCPQFPWISLWRAGGGQQKAP